MERYHSLVICTHSEYLMEIDIRVNENHLSEFNKMGLTFQVTIPNVEQYLEQAAQERANAVCLLPFQI